MWTQARLGKGRTTAFNGQSMTRWAAGCELVAGALVCAHSTVCYVMTDVAMLESGRTISGLADSARGGQTGALDTVEVLLAGRD